MDLFLHLHNCVMGLKLMFLLLFEFLINRNLEKNIFYFKSVFSLKSTPIYYDN